jgi:hypothetical protein
MNDKCIITHDGQSYLLYVLSFSVMSNIKNNVSPYINHNYYPQHPPTVETELSITFSFNNSFHYFLNAFNKNMVSNYPVSSVKFDMELRSSKGNMRFYGCYLNGYNMPISSSGLNNTVDCTIQSDYYMYEKISDEEFLRKERKEKLNEIFDGEL